MEQLAGKGLLSDRRFAESYVRSRVERGFGPLRIRQELRQRGVDDALVEASLDPYREGWLQCLIRVHDKRFGGGLPADVTEMARRARFLEYRGFAPDLIRTLFRGEDC